MYIDLVPVTLKLYITFWGCICKRLMLFRYLKCVLYQKLLGNFYILGHYNCHCVKHWTSKVQYMYKKPWSDILTRVAFVGDFEILGRLGTWVLSESVGAGHHLTLSPVLAAIKQNLQLYQKHQLNEVHNTLYNRLQKPERAR